MQLDFLRTIPGLEEVEILRQAMLSSTIISPLLSAAHLGDKADSRPLVRGAGQGTSGYEEAAARGSSLELNAALRVQEKAACVLGPLSSLHRGVNRRSSTRGTDEPYRNVHQVARRSD